MTGKPVKVCSTLNDRESDIFCKINLEDVSYTGLYQWTYPVVCAGHISQYIVGDTSELLVYAGSLTTRLGSAYKFCDGLTVETPNDRQA